MPSKLSTATVCRMFLILLVLSEGQWICGANCAAGPDDNILNTAAADDSVPVVLPAALTTVLDHTQPLINPRLGRLPLYVLPISGCLSVLPEAAAEEQLRLLDARGIGYTVDWHPAAFRESLAEGLRIARLQQKIGQPVAVHATACLQGFCDGSAETLHIDEAGTRFADHSCGGALGCPFALQHRIPVIRQQVEQFVQAYQDAGLTIDFIFADWEIDGPIEWNESRAASMKCVTCRSHVPDLSDFRKYQSALRIIRSQLQREAFAQPVTQRFPKALVGNYGVCPHDGYRYWYDYFEKTASDEMPFVADQKARYREWYPEFPETEYTFAMPVVYTWYPTFGWYNFDSPDYRWFYNMLKEASSVGANTSGQTPLIPFVHWHTTAPPESPDPNVIQMSPAAYQDLLWHMLLRGHDTFFLWCMPNELGEEIRLVHEVYRDSLQYAEFLTAGEPLNFDVPSQPDTIVSGLRLGNQALVRRSEYATKAPLSNVSLKTKTGPEAEFILPPVTGNQVISSK